MKLLNQDTTVNIVGFDLPALDNWMIRISIEFDLLNPSVLPTIRENIINTIKMYYTETGKFYEELKENKTLKGQSGPLATIRDALANARNAFNNNFDVLKVKSLTHEGSHPFDPDWGGRRNNKHNALARKYHTVKALLAAAPDELPNVILEYVNKPKFSPTLPQSKDALLDGELLEIPIPELNLVDNPNLQWGSAVMRVKRMHDSLDPDMVLHNLLVDAKALADLPKEYQLGKYQSALGKGIYPAYLERKFPEPDNEVRVVEWRAGLKLVGQEDVIPASKVPEMLAKENEDETPIKDLFSRARTKKQKLFYKASLMQYIVASEYLLPEESVIVDEPVEQLDGTKQKKFYMNIAFRPNRRVIGLREKENEHNENYVPKGLKPLFDTYFDSTTQKSYQTYKLVPDPLDPTGLLKKKVAIVIPKHGIDIFDMVLDNREKVHNKKVEAGLPGIFKDESGIVLKTRVDLKETLRSIFDQRYAADFRFEEIVLGFFLPLIDITVEHFTDPLTKKFFWKYATHEWRLDKERLQSLIVIIQTKPANTFATKKIHNILTSAFYRGAYSDFKDKDMKFVQPIISVITSNAPQLGIDILRTFMKNAEMLKELEATKPSKSFTQRNYTKILNNVPRLVDEYKNMINVYPFALTTNTPDMDAGWYYTHPQPEGVLAAIGLETEELELIDDRKELEFNLYFLETALRLLSEDFNKVSSERRYFVKVAAEEEGEEEEEVEGEEEGEKPKKKPKKKAAPAKPIIKGKTAESLRDIVVRVQKGIKVGDELRKLGVDKGLFKDWGQPDMLGNKADPAKLLFDVATELAAEPEYKDKANFQMLPAWIKENMKNARPADAPYDLLYVYELPNKSLADYLALFLRLYYDMEVIHVDIKPSKVKDGGFQIAIWKSIASILNEKMAAHYKEDIDIMQKDRDAYVKTMGVDAPPGSVQPSEFLKSVTNLGFSDRDDASALVVPILDNLIAAAKESQTAVEVVPADKIRKIVQKLVPDAEILSITSETPGDENIFTIYLRKALPEKMEDAIADAVNERLGDDFSVTFKYEVSGLESKLNI